MLSVRNHNVSNFFDDVWNGQSIAISGTETATGIRTEGYETIRIYHDVDQVADINVHASLDGSTTHGSIHSETGAEAGPGSFSVDVRAVPYVIIDVTNTSGTAAATANLTVGMG